MDPAYRWTTGASSSLLGRRGSLWSIGTAGGLVALSNEVKEGRRRTWPSFGFNNVPAAGSLFYGFTT